MCSSESLLSVILDSVDSCHYVNNVLHGLCILKATENLECENLLLICPQRFYNINNPQKYDCAIGSVAENKNVRKRTWKVMMHPINFFRIYNTYVEKQIFS